MRASGRFDRPRSCRRAAGSGRVALGRATRAKDGFAGRMLLDRSHERHSIQRRAPRRPTQRARARVGAGCRRPDGRAWPPGAGGGAAAFARRRRGEERGASRHGGRDPRRRGGDPRRQCGRCRRREGGGQTPAFLDRLALDEARLEAIAAAVEASPSCPTRSGACSRPSSARTGSRSSASRRRSASSA